ncbi:hypothetical protein BC831DRAFT_446929 [Entophlyctis helioformis]|nr:hypothetical protein BC831DRAFT_446929 [Entophlyctis helioformis]
MKQVAKRLVVRLDPHVKRTICKRCFTVLVPGVTMTVRTSDKPVPRVEMTCTCCSRMRSLPVDPAHVLFNDKNDVNNLSAAVASAASATAATKPSASGLSDMDLDVPPDGQQTAADSQSLLPTEAQDLQTQ